MRKNEAAWMDKYGHWRILVQKDGVRKAFYSSVKGSKGKIEAEKKADRWLLTGEGENPRTGELLEMWLADLKTSTSAEHVRQYDGYVQRYIAPEIERKRIAAVTEVDLQRIIDKAYRERHLAYKTLLNVRSCITAFMKYCRLLKVTTLRPENLKIPKSAARTEKRILQPEELKILFGDAEDHFIHAYRFAVLTGLRPGELLALKWSDMKGDVVRIRRSYNDRGDLTQGKNKNANRAFQLPELASKVLSEQRLHLKRLNLVSPYVFPDTDGNMCMQDHYRKTWYKFCERYGIQRITPYEMQRHTFVSIVDDLPDGLKKQVVGHSRSMDTEGVYGHQKKGDMERAALSINSAFKEWIK